MKPWLFIATFIYKQIQLMFDVDLIGSKPTKIKRTYFSNNFPYHLAHFENLSLKWIPDPRMNNQR